MNSEGAPSLQALISSGTIDADRAAVDPEIGPILYSTSVEAELTHTWQITPRFGTTPEVDRRLFLKAESIGLRTTILGEIRGRDICTGSRCAGGKSKLIRVDVLSEGLRDYSFRVTYDAGKWYWSPTDFNMFVNIKIRADGRLVHSADYVHPLNPVQNTLVTATQIFEIRKQ